jgi:hypothetical protein
MNQIIPTDPSVALEVQKMEIDTQIATAKSYPRDLQQFQKSCESMIALSPDIAAECVYCLPRGGKSIEGPSIRLAEIMMSNWKNLRVGAKVLEEGSEFIIIQAACHDLESNVAITTEIKRRITDKNGKRYKADMIQTTTAAAISIGIRNAVFKVIPNVFTKHYVDYSKKASVGPEGKFSERVKAAFNYFENMGVSEDRILDKLDLDKKTKITKHHLITLQGMATAIKENRTTLETEFPNKMREPEPAEGKKVSGDANAEPPDDFVNGVDNVGQN